MQYSLDVLYKLIHLFSILQDEDFEIPLDNDQQDLAFYSIQSGDTLRLSW